MYCLPVKIGFPKNVKKNVADLPEFPKSSKN